jgi:DNA-binding GntR family transcriptional regulator
MTALKRSTELKNTLEQEIVTGVMLPGAKLDEVSLAQRFGVSRTPVREALLYLSSIGLVEIRPRRSAIIATIGMRELIDMFEVMGELEAFCGRLSARRLSNDQRQKLKSIHERSHAYVNSRDHEKYYAVNVDFHEMIYQGSQNSFLADQTRMLRNRLSPYRRLQLRTQDRLSASFKYQIQNRDAILEGNSDLSAFLFQFHVTVQEGTFNDFVASLPADLIREHA